MRSLSCSALLLLSLSACDPTATSERPVTTPATADAPKAGEAKADEAAKPAEAKAETKVETPAAPADDAKAKFHACLTACDAAKPGERAQCRMNCEPASGPVAGGPDADGGIGKALQCFSACHDGKASDPKACSQACVTASAGVPNAPAQAVIEQLGTCVAECHADKTLKSTDRETCKLTCSQVASTAGPGGK